MNTSQIGRAAIKAREGERLKAYLDSVNVLTIGVGITTASGLITVTPGLVITPEQSDALFQKAAVKYENYVKAAIHARMTQEQFDAFVSICYNIGSGGFAGSTFAKKFNAGDIQGCARAILLWNKPSVIVTRRQAEHDQFLTPYSTAIPKARSTDSKPVRMGASFATPAVNAVTAPVAILAPAVTPPSPTKAPSGLWAILKALFSK